ncbi:hypothetical protein OHB26_15290 [Nocardia sp. NBC_01503]|uniref:hypothetical protein n=1 Tax=Nocardia sp. NBC_01503 TaxID=2975997 RepID=UPI002E7B0245|nr:hypothetical protein [Nocardia sp. NBC_01503]WTL35435.1 hypothetical protein OHB26_15290 [Nocardia sp. NBC_01503]
MTMVRAGVVPGRRAAWYGVAAVLVTAAICGGMVGAFGVNRVFTGLLLGIAAGIALLFLLFGRDGVVLTEDSIVRRTPWGAETLAWDRVVAGRFALDEQARWSLALDLNGGQEPHGELVLLSIPPVVKPIANAYDMRKREQVNEIRGMLRGKRIPVTVLPEIADALTRHWRLAPPTHGDTAR